MKKITLSNKDGFSLLQVLRSLNDMTLIGKLDPTLSARRASHLINVLEDEIKTGLGTYATQLDQIIANANAKFMPDLLAIPESERVTTNVEVQLYSKHVNEEIENAALLVGLTPQALENVEISIESDDRAKFLNTALDQLATSWTSRKSYLAVCDAVEQSLA